MNVSNTSTTRCVPGNPQRPPNDPAKPKRIRRPPFRRPKVFPDPIRHKLTLLGLSPSSESTTDATLNDLMHNMRYSLQHYQDAAKYWQQQLQRLETKAQLPIAGGHCGLATQDDFDAERASDGLEVPLCVTEESQESLEGPISAFEYDLLNRLRRQQHPTLHVATLTDLHFQSKLSYSAAEADAMFYNVMCHSSQLAHVYGLYKGVPGHQWRALTQAKPDFEESVAYRIWHLIFEPINTSPSSVCWNASSASRAMPTTTMAATSSTMDEDIDPDDLDYDALDRWITKATDQEVLEALHYSSILLLGLNQLAWLDAEYHRVLTHAGKNSERLLREVLFVRNISEDPRLTHDLLSSIAGLVRYFIMFSRPAACVTLLEVAWEMSKPHLTYTNLTIRGLITLMSTLLSSKYSRRGSWTTRIHQLSQLSKNAHNVFLSITSHICLAFFALMETDLETLLSLLVIMEEIIDSTKVQPRLLENQSNNMYLTDINNSNNNNNNYVNNNNTSNNNLNTAMKMTPTTTTTTTTTATTETSSYCCSSRQFFDQALSSSSSVSFSQPFSPPTLLPTPPPPLQPQYDCSSTPSSSASTSSNPFSPTSATNASLYQQGNDFAIPLHIATNMSEDQLERYLEKFRDRMDARWSVRHDPSEEFKTVMRCTVRLFRAEAALMINDYESCVYWVDEADKLLANIPRILLNQLFIIDTHVLYAAFYRTCPFPSGTRTIIDEFEMRIKLRRDTPTPLSIDNAM